MSNKKSWLVPAVLILSSFLGVSSARAENPACYTLASLQGSWAVNADYGVKVAIALGQRYVDGNGNMTGVFVQNAPVVGDPTGARTITTGTQVGVYAVNCDGTGTLTRTVTSSTGVVTSPVDDFIITKAIVQKGQFIAIEIVDVQRTPSVLVPGGLLITRIHTRLPERPGPTQP